MPPPCAPEGPLDNAVWWALSGRHHRYASAVGRARRYRPDVSVFAAVDGFDEESWIDLAQLLGGSGSGVLFGADVPAALPDGWITKARGRGHQMVVQMDQLQQVTHHRLRRLAMDDVPLMVELVAATNPGPFRPATIELGRYFGYFDGQRLMAMAGERLGFDGYTEISAVCTHPDGRGRGLAATLTHHIASGIFERGEQPFLHVAESNERALRIYQRLGFTQRKLVEFALVEAPPN